MVDVAPMPVVHIDEVVTRLAQVLAESSVG